MREITHFPMLSAVQRAVLTEQEQTEQFFSDDSGSNNKITLKYSVIHHSRSPSKLKKNSSSETQG
jgi:hypothetical protein